MSPQAVISQVTNYVNLLCFNYFEEGLILSKEDMFKKTLAY